MNAANGSQLTEDYPEPVVVEEFKALRACLSCGLIKSFDMVFFFSQSTITPHYFGPHFQLVLPGGMREL